MDATEAAVTLLLFAWFLYITWNYRKRHPEPKRTVWQHLSSLAVTLFAIVAFYAFGILVLAGVVGLSRAFH
jgi:heme/copper-type cytochrome/quinol oxidase subunit 2